MKSVTESKLWYSRKQRRVFKKRLKRRKRAQLREASLAIQEPTIPPQSEDDEVKRAAELQAWIATEAKFQKKFTEKRKKLEDEEKRKPKRNSKDSGQSSVNPCTFFMKTGACRFGVLCRNPHPYPSVSTTLLLKNMFDLPVSGSQAETQDEAEDVDIPEDSLDTMFVTFWQDIIPELHKYGKLKSVLVCRNHSRHLCGSVYVTYHSVEDSRKAFGELQGRFYASRPLQVFYCSISDWSKAICGLFLQNRCGRGKTCNLLHPFQNPDGECQVETEIFHREKKICLIPMTEIEGIIGDTTEKESHQIIMIMIIIMMMMTIIMTGITTRRSLIKVLEETQRMTNMITLNLTKTREEINNNMKRIMEIPQKEKEMERLTISENTQEKL